MDEQNLSVYLFTQYGLVPWDFKKWLLLVGVVMGIINFFLDEWG